MFLFISTDENPEHRYHVDFFHGLTISMLIIIMALGSLVITSLRPAIMPLAIFQMSLGVIVFILIVSWLWVIFAGQEGVEPLWARHLYNLGNTFEQWLEHLAQPSNHKNLTPQEFLRAGLEQLMIFPWIKGITWHSLYGEEMLGLQDKQKVVLTVQSLEITVYAHYRISGTHYFQIKVLIQLLEHFHQAKRREAAFAQQAHLQAIHETGAKLTHDIKNLLQSLHAITSVIETYPATKFGDTQRLLQGQMPHLTQRLKRTLDKLQKPAEFSYSHVPVSLWWGNLKARYRKSQIEFTSQLETEHVLIPEDLFDNVSENLLQNALMKRKREQELQIRVSLDINKRRLQLTVCDDGSPISEEITHQLLTQPVPSRDGFGIGLYQAVKQLAHTGYVLNILENVEGQVCFELASTE
jgi:signal transduction histidine kinase